MIKFDKSCKLKSIEVKYVYKLIWQESSNIKFLYLLISVFPFYIQKVNCKYRQYFVSRVLSDKVRFYLATSVY